MMFRWTLLVPVLGLVGLYGYGSPSKSEVSSGESQSSTWVAEASPEQLSQGQPNLPIPLQSQPARGQYRDVVEHPWVRLQPGLNQITDAMVEDVRSLQKGHEELNARRKQAGLPTNTFEEESNRLVLTIQEIQAALQPLNLAFPSNLYSVLNIPASTPTSNSTPLPFDVYKRVELGKTDLGIPYYLDVRVFSLADLMSQTAKDATIQAIINWHLGLLDGGEKAFSALTGKNALVFLGHGDRNREHFDGAHGFATQNRGVFLAFLTDGRHLFVLHADAPWDSLQSKKDLFLKVVNRQLTPLNNPISDYRLVAIDSDSRTQ